MPVPGWFRRSPNNIFQRLRDMQSMLADFELYAVGTSFTNADEHLSEMANDLLVLGVTTAHWTNSSRCCETGPLAKLFKTDNIFRNTSVTRLHAMLRAFAVQVGNGNASFVCASQQRGPHGDSWAPHISAVSQAEMCIEKGREECKAVAKLIRKTSVISSDQAKRIEQHHACIEKLHRIVEKVMENDPVILFTDGQFKVRISTFCDIINPDRQPPMPWLHGAHKLSVMTGPEIQRELDTLISASERLWGKDGTPTFARLQSGLRLARQVWPSLRFVLELPATMKDCPAHLEDRYDIIKVVAFRYVSVNMPSSSNYFRLLAECRHLKDQHLASQVVEPQTGGNGQEGHDESQSSNAGLDALVQNPYIPTQLSDLRANILKRKSQDEEAVSAQKKLRLDQDAHIQRLNNEVESMKQECQKAQDLAAQWEKRYHTAKADLDALQTEHTKLKTEHAQLKAKDTQLEQRIEQLSAKTEEMRAERDAAVSKTTDLQKKVRQMEEALRHTDEVVTELTRALKGEDGS